MGRPRVKLCSALFTNRNHIFKQKQEVPARKHLVSQYVDVGLAVEGGADNFIAFVKNFYITNLIMRRIDEVF